MQAALYGLDRAASPSSRRAWIEIQRNPSLTLRRAVALLAEGVDRNLIGLDVVLDPANVALLAEGVDRNCMVASMP